MKYYIGEKVLLIDNNIYDFSNNEAFHTFKSRVVIIKNYKKEYNRYQVTGKVDRLPNTWWVSSEQIAPLGKYSEILYGDKIDY